MSTSKVYYHPARQSAFLTLEKLAAVLPTKNDSDVSLVRTARCIYASQTCEEAVLSQSIYCYERVGRVEMQYVGRTDPRKIQ